MVAFKEIGIINSYTLESTFYAPYSKAFKKKYNVDDEMQVKGADLLQIGYDFCETLVQIVQSKILKKKFQGDYTCETKKEQAKEPQKENKLRKKTARALIPKHPISKEEEGRQDPYQVGRVIQLNFSEGRATRKKHQPIPYTQPKQGNSKLLPLNMTQDSLESSKFPLLVKKDVCPRPHSKQVKKTSALQPEILEASTSSINKLDLRKPQNCGSPAPRMTNPIIAKAVQSKTHNTTLNVNNLFIRNNEYSRKGKGGDKVIKSKQQEVP